VKPVVGEICGRVPSGAGCNMAWGATWIFGFYNKGKQKQLVMMIAFTITLGEIM